MRKLILIFGIAAMVALTFFLGNLADGWLEGTSYPYLVNLLVYLGTALPVLVGIPLLVMQFGMKPPEGGAPREPKRQYVRRVLGFGVLYAVILIASVQAMQQFEVATSVRVMLALLTALPIGGMLGAMGVYISNPKVDEFERMLLTRSLLWATGLTLFMATVWGFLADFGAAPAVPMYMMVPFFFMFFGLTQPLVRRQFQ